MFFEGKYQSRMSDYDRTGKISPEAVMQILEVAGGSHAESVKDNLVADGLNGVGWIVAEWNIRILCPMESGKELSFCTWVRGRVGTYTTFRDFSVCDADGKETVRAEATMCLFDLKNGKPVRTTEAFMQQYGAEEKTAFDSLPARLRPVAAYETETPIVLRRSDIDFNGHVHNTRYLDFAMEALPHEVYAGRTFTQIRIVYSKPITESDTVIAKYAPYEDGCFVGVYVGDTLHAMVELH